MRRNVDDPRVESWALKLGGELYGTPDLRLGSPDQPRDENGRWSAADSARGTVEKHARNGDTTSDDDKVLDASNDANAVSEKVKLGESKHGDAARRHYEVQEQAEGAASKHRRMAEEGPQDAPGGPHRRVSEREREGWAEKHNRIAGDFDKLARAHEDAGLDHDDENEKKLSLGSLILGDLVGHEFRGNQYTKTEHLADTPENRKLAGERVRAFIDKYTHPGMNVVSIAMSKHYDVKQGLNAKHRGIGEKEGEDHPSKGKKTSELYPKGIVRLTTGRYQIGFNYERNVQQQQAREEKPMDFKAGPAHHGATVHAEDKPQVMQHTSGKEFLQVSPTGKGFDTEAWVDAATGRHLSEAEVADVKKNLVSDKKSPRAEGAQGGIEKEKMIQTISLTNIYMMKAKVEDGWHKINKLAFENHPEGTKLSLDSDSVGRRMARAFRTALGIHSDLELAREDMIETP